MRQAIEKRLNELLDQSLALDNGIGHDGAVAWLGSNGPREDPTGGDGRGLDDADAEEECEDEGAQCEDEGVLGTLVASAAFLSGSPSVTRPRSGDPARLRKRGRASFIPA